MKLLRYLYRVIRWAIKSLWLGRRLPRPTIAEGRKYARGYLRKFWRPVLQGIDRQFNDTRDLHLLMDRKIAVLARRREKFPEVGA